MFYHNDLYLKNTMIVWILIVSIKILCDSDFERKNLIDAYLPDNHFVLRMTSN